MNLNTFIRKCFNVLSAKIRLFTKFGSSVSDDGLYTSEVKRAVHDAAYFKDFRRKPFYRQIIECVSQEEGEECLKILDNIWPHWIDNWDEYLKNDNVGNPILHNFLHEVSGKQYSFLADPYTIQKIMQIGEMRTYCPELFDKNNSFNIVEIGVGFGALCRLLLLECNIKEYAMYDLPNVLLLTQKWLQTTGVNTHNIIPKTIDEADTVYDFCISNYAFSELSPKFQKIYLNNVIKFAKHGFMICNNLTQLKFGGGVYSHIAFIRNQQRKIISLYALWCCYKEISTRMLYCCVVALLH